LCSCPGLSCSRPCSTPGVAGRNYAAPSLNSEGAGRCRMRLQLRLPIAAPPPPRRTRARRVAVRIPAGHHGQRRPRPAGSQDLRLLTYSPVFSRSRTSLARHDSRLRLPRSVDECLDGYKRDVVAGAGHSASWRFRARDLASPALRRHNVPLVTAAPRDVGTRVLLSRRTWTMYTSALITSGSSSSSLTTSSPLNVPCTARQRRSVLQASSSGRRRDADSDLWSLDYVVDPDNNLTVRIRPETNFYLRGGATRPGLYHYSRGGTSPSPLVWLAPVRRHGHPLVNAAAGRVRCVGAVPSNCSSVTPAA